jgi:uncharacterized protein YneR
MKWFKHYSDMHDGETIAELFENLGHKGLAFFLLQELCCEKLEKNKDQILQESDCVFRFPVRIVRQKLRLSGGNLAELLRICATKGQLSYSFDENIVEIKMPILLYLLDSDSKKARQKRAEAATQSRLDKDKEEDKDLDKDKESKLPALRPKPTAQDSEQNKLIKTAYVNAYRLRYGVEPSTNSAQFNSQVANLRKKIGAEDAVKVVEFYLTHNDHWYVKKTHSFNLCLADADTLRTQMLRGKAITTNDVRQFEKQDQLTSQLNRIKEGKV